MLNINSVKAGQRVTVVYSSPVNWARKTGNRFLDLDVQKHCTVAFTACGQETYAKQMNKHGETMSDRKPWFSFAPDAGECVVRHTANRTPYLAGINHDYVKSEVTIGGKPATEAELEEMQAFLRNREERERGLDFQVWTLDKLVNAKTV